MSSNGQIPPEEVRHMAKLSKLKISDEESDLFSRQLGQILDHMKILQKVDTQDIEPLFRPLIQPEETRNDKPENLRTHQEIMANAPVTDGEYFIVPRIV